MNILNCAVPLKCLYNFTDRRGGFYIRPFYHEQRVKMIGHHNRIRTRYGRILMDYLVKYAAYHAGGYGIRPYGLF